MPASGRLEANLRNQWIASLETYVFPNIGTKPVDKVTSANVMACLTPIWHSRSTTAKRILQRISAIMRWSVGQGFREDNPADERIIAALGSNSRPSKHFQAVHHTEVAAAIGMFRGSRAYPTVRLAVEFAILTATRSGETRGARWSEINLVERLWEIPAGRMKADRSHRVPLSDRAVDLLTEAARFKNPGGLVFPYRNGQEIPSWVLPKLLKRLNIGGTLHGMRTAFRNWCAEKGTSREVAETCLAHRIGTSAEQAYRRTDLLERRRHLMGEWSRYLESPRTESNCSSQTAMGWEQAAKLDAHNNNRELLTPQAACEVFGISVPTVHRAVAENLVCVQFQLRITTKPLDLIRLESAVHRWGQPDPHLLHHMRDHGQVLGIEGQSYNILNVNPLVTPVGSEALKGS